MANEVARGGGGQPRLPLAFLMPDYPAGTSIALVNAVALVTNPHPDIPTPKKWLDRIAKDAAIALEAIRPLCVPAPYEVIDIWMARIVQGVEYTPTEEDASNRVSALHFASGGVPRVAGTQQAQIEGLHTWRRMPSVAQVMELVLPPVMPLLSRYRALRRIVDCPD